MGKVAPSIVTAEQQVILSAFKEDSSLRSRFYFTGGTALSLYYLHHRVSEDLDFFSEQKFNFDNVATIVDSWKKKYRFTATLRQVETVRMFFLAFPSGVEVKVDFVHYPHRRVEQSQNIDNMQVDSMFDIAINKLNTVIQRSQVKDFVDLYFLLKEFSLWDLIRGVEVKFGYEIDQIFLASDFMKVKDFDFLPKMIVPLTISQLRTFFKELAREIGKQITEP